MKQNNNKGNSVFVKVSCVLLIAVGLVLIGLSTISVLVSTAITIGMVMPAGMGLLMIIYAFTRLKKKGRVIQRKWMRIAITIFLVVGLLGAASLETLMCVAAYKPPPEEDTGFVIVLGCGVFPDGTLTLSLKNRLDAAYDYLTAHEDSLCIVSGGQGDNEPVSEAEAMSQYLRSRGIDDNRVIKEDRSTSTLLNLTYSKEIMAANDDRPQTAAIVTSDYHVFRALMLTREMEIDAFGIPAATNWKIVVACHVREYAAIIKTVLFGGEEL